MFLILSGLFIAISLANADTECGSNKNWMVCYKQGQPICPDGYFKIRNSCFKAFNGKKNFDDANSLCRIDGGLLAGNNLEADFVIGNELQTEASVVNTKTYWVGASYDIVEKKFRWEDGSQYVTDIISKTIELSNAAHTCVEGKFPDKIQFSNADCSKEQAFICEIQAREDCLDTNEVLQVCAILVDCQVGNMIVSIHTSQANVTIGSQSGNEEQCGTVSGSDSNSITTINNAYEDCSKIVSQEGGGLFALVISVNHISSTISSANDLRIQLKCKTAKDTNTLTKSIGIGFPEGDFEDTSAGKYPSTIFLTDTSGDLLEESKIVLGTNMCVQMTYTGDTDSIFIALRNLYVFSPEDEGSDRQFYVKLYKDGCLEDNPHIISNPGYIANCTERASTGSCGRVITKCIKTFKFTNSNQLNFKAQLEVRMPYLGYQWNGQNCIKRRKRSGALALSYVVVDKLLTVYTQVEADEESAGSHFYLNWGVSFTAIIVCFHLSR